MFINKETIPNYLQADNNSNNNNNNNNNNSNKVCV
jgi:hypothetical protein